MKYAGVGAGLFLLLMAVTVIILPLVINVQRYLPEIEEKLSDLTGRPVTIGSDLALSFFPSPGMSFSHLQIGNPEGYLSDGFVRIASFEARFALLPLLKREIAISRFIISGLEVNLEKRADGKVNWDFSQKPSRKESNAEPIAAVVGWSLPQGMSIALLVVTDGVINWLDSADPNGYRFDELMFIAHDFNFDDPVAVEFKASIAGNALAAEGTVGPFDHRFGHELWPVDLAARFIDTFSGQIKGKTIEPWEDRGTDFVLQVPPFLVRDLVAFLAADVPAGNPHPATIQSVDIDAHGTGKKEEVGTGKVRINPLEIKESRP